jgi:glycyl-tRNA synthetase beta chain
MADLLFEIFSEEMPARMQQGALEQLQDKLKAALAEARLEHSQMHGYVSPRHLAVRVDGLPAQQPDQTIERKGPKISAPEQAIEGFCKSVGLNKDQLEVRKAGKDDCYFAVKEEKGQPTADALKGMLEGILQGFHWPKSMRWGAHEVSWVRPMQNLLCLFDGNVVPVQFGHLTANNLTYGHRFLAPDAIEIASADDYLPALTTACVMVEREVRKAQIQTMLEEAAAERELVLVEDAGLLDEVAGLVEWPTVLLGEFEEHYLKLPPEVLLSEMREHQKYFGAKQADGSISNHFFVTANLPTADGGAAIVHGNGRVLRARLADGEFYWDADRATPLNDWAAKLEGLIFHAKIGSVKDRAERMKQLAPLLAVFVPHANLSECARAAELAKADLTTGMVGEFPELQGIMGRYYAQEQGEAPAVADAIAEHYSPLGASDDVPNAPVSVVAALCDKLDALVGLFAIGEKPTGSKDPFALRRAALGVIRIILENQLRMPLKLAFDKTASLYPKKLFAESKDATVAQLLGFFEDRLKVMLKGQGVRHDVIAAVMADSEDDLLLIAQKAKALQAFLDSDAGANLLAAYKRASNILRAEEQKDDARYDAKVDAGLLSEPKEKELYEALEASDAPVKEALKDERFDDVMRALAALRAPLDAYFDKVMVNVDEADVRRNRLNTLNHIRASILQVADFEKLEG